MEKSEHRKHYTWTISLSTLSVLVAVWLLWQRHPDLTTNLFEPLPIFPGPVPVPAQRTFKLQHIYHHSTAQDFKTHLRLDITSQYVAEHSLHEERPEEWSRLYEEQSPWTVSLPFKSQDIELKRLADRHPDTMQAYIERMGTGQFTQQDLNLEWRDDVVDAPNVTDKDTVITLALMSSNAYVETPRTGDWRDVAWNHSIPHGWNGTGIRGHIFVSDDNSTVVVAYKGTSAAYLSGSGSDDTVTSDRDNDNLLFSCCCARVGYMWTPVCDCYRSSYTCDQRCLEKELYRKDKYYQAALDIFRNVTNMYPRANIWATGHSLGGSLASLVGRTFGIPAVGFEAPGELLATKRLHLPMPPGLPSYMEGIWHFGHTADPIYMGVCNGASSTCSIGGYALETQCHSGKVCVYDVVADKGWHVNMLNHRIHTVIDEVITAYNETAPCVQSPPCRDCYNWNFVDGDQVTKPDKPDKNPVKKPENGLSTTSSASSSVPPEPTSGPVCKKYTWYGRCYEWEGDDE